MIDRETEARATLNSQYHGREASLFANGFGQLLITGDTQLSSTRTRVGAGEKGPIATVSAGVGQSQPGDDRELIAQVFERLQDRRDLPVLAKGLWGVVATVHPHAPHAEDGSLRPLGRRDAAGVRDRLGQRAHALEPRERDSDTRATEESAAGQDPVLCKRHRVGLPWVGSFFVRRTSCL